MLENIKLGLVAIGEITCIYMYMLKIHIRDICDEALVAILAGVFTVYIFFSSGREKCAYYITKLLRERIVKGIKRKIHVFNQKMPVTHTVNYQIGLDKMIHTILSENDISESASGHGWAKYIHNSTGIEETFDFSKVFSWLTPQSLYPREKFYLALYKKYGSVKCPDFSTIEEYISADMIKHNHEQGTSYTIRDIRYTVGVIMNYWYFQADSLEVSLDKCSVHNVVQHHLTVRDNPLKIYNRDVRRIKVIYIVDFKALKKHFKK